MKTAIFIIVIGFSMMGMVLENKSQCQNSDSLIVATLAFISPDSMQSYMQNLQDMGTRFMISPNRKETAT